MDVAFLCPHCKQKLSSDESLAGQTQACPHCGQHFIVPNPHRSAPQSPPPSEFCPKCGQNNQAGSIQCSACGFDMRSQPAPRAVPGDASLGGLIPYKNAWALWAYYLGVFALIPCVTVVPLGIGAIVCGIMGVRYANRYPEAKGKAHAWTGIILGLLSLVLSTAGVLFLLWSMGA